MKKFKSILKGAMILSIVSIIGISVVKTNGVVHADEKTVSIQNDYDGESVASGRAIKENETTDLLHDEQGNDLQKKEYNGKNYDLKEISISRYRQKVRIEYYVGNYNTSTFIGSDEGYADYDDSVRDYIKKVDELNTKFGQNIPTGYKMVPYPGSSFSYVPAYDGTDNPYVVKVLVAEVKRYSVSAGRYQNRQDKMNPNPIGKTKAEIDSTDDFWKVYSLGTSFSAIVGQTVDLKTTGQFYDSTTNGGRTGALQHFGTYDDAGLYYDTSTLTITETTPTSLSIAGFYEVDDYGSPVVKPGTSSGMTSGGSITFVGNDIDWKTPVATETLDVANDQHMQKLAAYPFQLADDPFDAPEHPLYYVPANWALGHKLEITYRYEKNNDPVTPPLTPDPITPEPTDPVVKPTPKPSVSKEVIKESVATSDSTNIAQQLLLVSCSILVIIGMGSYYKYSRKES